MGLSRSIDAIDLGNVALPYDTMSKAMDDTPRLIAGSDNVYGLANEALAKRPGFTKFADIPTAVGRIDKLWIYETEEVNPQVLLLASIFSYSTGFWTMWWIDPDAGPPVWNNMGSLRGLNESTKVHRAVIHKGRVYIKGYPDPSTGEDLGSVVFSYEGTTPSVKRWGMVGPTQPARVSSSGGWGASAHPVTVRIGWKYAYSWEFDAGNISSRSPIETDPDEDQSSTGPFTNLNPEVVVRNSSKARAIIIWRTLDGGGNYLFLDRVTPGPADSDYTYTDNQRESGGGGTFDDPQSDTMLDSANVAPSETSNDPPPPITDAGTGVLDPGDDPLEIGDAIEKSTNIVSSQGRLWYGIRTVLFFSGLEEINNGIPEHCWPSGFTGNYIPIGEPTVALDTGPLGVVRFSTKHVYITSGFNRESFAETRVLSNSGMPAGHPNAHCSYQDVVFWVTSDFRVCALVGNQMIVLSKPLKDEIEPRLSADTSTDWEGPRRELELHAWANQENQYLFLLLRDKSDVDTRMWVYDLVRKAWNPPWFTKVTTMATGRPRTSAEKEELIGATFNGANSQIVHLDLTDKRDFIIGAGNTNYGFNIVTNLMRVPIGNHVNPLRRAGMVPDVLGFVLHRTKFTGDSAPAVTYRLDDTTGSFTTLSPLADPPRRAQSSGYNEDWYMLNRAGQRAQIYISKTAVNQDFELQNLSFIFRPEAGP